MSQTKRGGSEPIGLLPSALWGKEYP